MDDLIPLPSGRAQYLHRSSPSLNNLWATILSAPSSGDALTIAATFHPLDLSSASFPGPLDNLSAAARENATAVHRAFDIPIEGLSSTGWEKWVDDSDEREEDEPVDSLTSSGIPHSPLRAAAAHEAHSDRPSAPAGMHASLGVDVTSKSSTADVKGVTQVAKKNITTGTGTATGTAIVADTTVGAGAVATTTTKTAATTVATTALKETTISPEDIRHAEALRSWACTRAHAAPPSDAIVHLCRVRSLSLIIPRIFSDSTQQGQSNPLSLSSPLATTAPVSVMVAVLHAFCGRPDEAGSTGDGDNNGEVISLGTANSEALYTHVVMPYLCRLQASAPRDMLQAVTQLCTRYWRPAVKALFEPFSLSSAQPTNPTRIRTTHAHSQSNSKRGSETIIPRLNAPVAELLARVAKTALPVESAMQALTLFCAPDAILWPDYAVPLIDALFSRVTTGTIPSMTTAMAAPVAATTDPGNQLTDDPHQHNHRHDANGSLNAADVLVPALARNASALEKSVRFGKLLFTLVKDVQEIKTRHRDAMETVCSRSRVFLAKRALDMLRKNGPS